MIWKIFFTSQGINYASVDDLFIDNFLKVHALLYADDLILISSSANELQNCLNALGNYCQTNKLFINAEKSKVLIFSKRKMQFEQTLFVIMTLWKLYINLNI